METRTAAQATEALIQDYGKLVFHVIYGLTGHWQESEDLTQETFIQAFRGIDTARAASGPQFQAKAWLLQVAVNTTRMFWRRQHALRFITFSDLQPGRSAVERVEEPTALYEEIQEAGDLETTIAERDTMQRCMAHLPEALRIPLLLSIVAGFSSSEIAQMLSLNEAAVRQRLTRARKAFQRRYAQESGEHLRVEMTTARSQRQTSRSRDHVRHRVAALAPAAL
jgi:RNA polymerase sigma-70 factor (ECF subfamily)